MNTQFQTSIAPTRTFSWRIRQTHPKGKFRAFLMAFLVAVGLMVSSVPSWAQTEEPTPQERRPNPDTLRIFLQIAQEVRHMVDDVNLSDAQRTAIENSLKQTAPQAEALRKTLKGKHDTLRDQLVANPADTARLEAIANDIAATQSQLVHVRVTRMADVAKQLTPQQRQRIAEGVNHIEELLMQLQDEARISQMLSAHAPATTLADFFMENAALKQLRADLKAIMGKSNVTPEQRQKLAQDLASLVKSANKPSEATVNQLVSDLQNALADRKLTKAELTQIAKSLTAVFTSAGVPQSQIDAVVAEFKAVLKASNVTESDIQKIVADIQAVLTQIRK